MGGLWVCKISQKISRASDQYFLSYVKKTTGGGQIDPPPSGNRVKGGFLRFKTRDARFALLPQYDILNVQNTLIISSKLRLEHNQFVLQINKC